jgi:hypothetical protein
VAPAALTAGALAADIAQGGQQPGTAPAWQLGGTATVRGVRCTVLTDRASKPFSLTEYLYVDTATGLPLQVGYGTLGVTSFFGNWGHVAAVTPPPASEVVV